MKRLFKTLTIVLIAVVAACACVFAITACNKEESKSDYNFTIVYEDGTAVNGEKDSAINDGKVSTQLCLTGEGAACYDIAFILKIYPDANGKLNLSQAQVNQIFGSQTDVTEFVFHVMQIKDHKNDCEVHVNGKGDYKVVVTAA